MQSTKEKFKNSFGWKIRKTVYFIFKWQTEHYLRIHEFNQPMRMAISFSNRTSFRSIMDHFFASFSYMRHQIKEIFGVDNQGVVPFQWAPTWKMVTCPLKLWPTPRGCTQRFWCVYRSRHSFRCSPVLDLRHKNYLAVQILLMLLPREPSDIASGTDISRPQGGVLAIVFN